MYYSKEQKEKDEALAKLHKDFALVLQVLLHAAVQTLWSPDDAAYAGTLLSECERCTADLCQILFDFFWQTFCAASLRYLREGHRSISLSFDQLWLPYEGYI